MAIDIIARGMIEDSNGNISQLSEKVSNHTDNSDIHVTVSDKENWNSHPNDVTASGNPVQIDGLQGGVPFSEMIVSGKNLLTYPYKETTKTVNGITFTDNGDGTITANGTAVANSVYDLSNFTYKKGINYILSGCPNGGGNSTYKIKSSKTGLEDDVGNAKLIRVEEDVTSTLCILVYNGCTVENLVFRPQLELGTTPTAYEPYHGSTTTITPDSNPYVIPNDIRQQEGLNVVSVSEGELSVTGVRKNAAVKKIWDEIDEIKTAIIVSNGETIE